MTDIDELMATERRLLGAVMVSDQWATEATCWLKAGNFRSLRHAAVFDSVNVVLRRHGYVGAVEIAEDLRDRGLLDAIGGPRALHAMVTVSTDARTSDLDYLLKHTPATGAGGQ